MAPVGPVGPVGPATLVAPRSGCTPWRHAPFVAVAGSDGLLLLLWVPPGLANVENTHMTMPSHSKHGNLLLTDQHKAIALYLGDL